MTDSSLIRPVDGEVPDGYGFYNEDTRNLYETLSKAFTDVDDALVDVTITSPPYADVKDYGYDEELQVGLGDDYEDYLEELRDIYKQTYDVTKPDGSLWVVVNTFKKGGRTVRLPTDIADVCENLEDKTTCDECGAPLDKDRETGILYCSDDCGFEYDATEGSWVLQDIVIWDKVRALPYSGTGKFRNVFEYILCFSKQNDFHFDLDKIRIADPAEFKDWWIDYPERYHPRGMVPDNIWEMVTPTQGGWSDMTIDHPAPFPRELVERIVHLTTEPDDVVFDPFGGTGTVLGQSEAMGRWPLGFELSEEFVEAYPDLRGEIFEEWDERREESHTLQDRQAQLAKKVWRLRQLIYPRKLLQSFPDDAEDRDMSNLGINTIFVSGERDSSVLGDRDTERVSSSIAVVLDDDMDSSDCRHVEELLQRSQENEPCSDMPIDAELSVLTVSEFLDEAAGDYESDSHYVYNKNSFNYPAGKVSLDDWTKLVANPDSWREKHVAYSYPPVLSNLYINVDEDGKEVANEIEPFTADSAGARITDF
ncbi:site-specific DNA-methyltransferase [Natronomonas pharaonis DSM 2160]|uniref:site-specific DNA-methyltransferase (cytosine-N(4)-specific) n=1 Tax=Natronomonas pharaonis (strain ATCC 35678 / DSM 2160 / CIP 103997 / JCM 8858 / NBRC 14720 / NCIMB 2260 / Gabara) TaxID=348780 RepID=A0A1U7EW25_NATPD|nr:site-specific DNA-methyltransferase [Natronomonas pharaonis]CAI49270.1 site-specific DNA-methyltransferase [Natronomonas pharaonis DSM 2160]